MRRTFRFHYGAPTLNLFLLILVLGTLLWLPCPPSLSQAQALPPPEPITSSGLSTQVNLSATPPPGNVQYDITGGTRPGGGANLFHSFGDFGVPPNNIANFVNGVSFDLNGNPLATGLPTSNILARVTGNIPSDIFGTIQTTGFGNANLFLMNPYGFLFGPNATVNVGGMVAFTSADYLRLEEIGGANAGIFHADLTQPSLLTAAPVAAFGFLGSNPGAITVQGGALRVPIAPDPETGQPKGSALSLIGGDINISADPDTGTPAALMAPSGQINLVSVTSPGEILFPSLNTGPNINGQTFTTMGTVNLADGSVLDVSDSLLEGDGHGGSIRIRGGQFVMDTSAMLAFTAGDVDGATTGISIAMQDDVTLRNLSTIASGTFGLGRAGDINIDARNIDVQGGSEILTDGAADTQAGQAGNISLVASESIIVSGIDEFEGRSSSIFSQTRPNTADSRGDSGSILIQAPSVTLNDGGIILTIATAIGRAGDITLDVTNLSILGGGEVGTLGAGSDSSSGNVTIRATDTVTISGQLNPDTLSKISNRVDGLNPGTQGDVSISAREIILADQGQIRSENFGQGGGGSGNVTLEAEASITMSSGARIVTKANFTTVGGINLSAPLITVDQSTIFARSVNEFQGGGITLSGNTLTISGASEILSSTEQSTGQGGAITLAASDTVSVSSGSIIRSSTLAAAEGPAGPITITADNLVALSGTETGLFSESFGSGDGGAITVRANQVQMNNSASVSASSTGPGNAGNISIDAGNQLILQNSSITTEANQSSGGAIKITTNPSGTVELINSLISASVLDGTGGGGSVDIDPQYVILLNSQILANAVQGPGGNIFITTNFFLPDANSVISASSQFGVNGTVTIQSPNAPASGQIQPLGKSPLIATSLLNQHCAALTDGEFSSFTVAGRDSLPTEPGNWLASPLYAEGVGTGEGLSGLSSLSGLSGVVRAGLAAHQIDQTDQIDQKDQTLLSLRQIAPAGFLTQAFAVDWSASCQS